MAKTEIKHPGKQVSTGAYSAGILMDGWLWVSGHAAEDLKTGEPAPGDTAEQTRVALRNIGKVLEAAGAGFADVVKSTCHLADINDFDAFNAAYAEFFPPPLPARTTVQSGLPGDLKVEIDVIARVKEKA
ncbi:MAG: RidA family protein [Bryobacteraceae bacterium]